MIGKSGVKDKYDGSNIWLRRNACPVVSLPVSIPLITNVWQGHLRCGDQPCLGSSAVIKDLGKEVPVYDGSELPPR